jgi:hypothetical protein
LSTINESFWSLKMKSTFVAVMCSAAIGILALSSPALAAGKTAKECAAEWKADKAKFEAEKVTEKAYVAKCRAEAEPKSKPAAAKEEKAAPKETAKEKKAEEKKGEKMAAPAGGGKKTAKECREEWQANKSANQAKGITEKAYVASCQAGTAAAAPAAAPTAAPAPAPAAAPKEKASAPMAPATGTPGGANQYAAESQAKSRCGSGTVVWANLDSKIYHFSGHADYGHTKSGAYMCEKDAMSQGMRAAKNEKHP